ncbi:MAG TPA: four helix bundle protein [Candidatus Moranbacteria bacterium]|nr:four helix bundle protein [Candidatus Moranbacteria bacterium]
MVIQKEKEAYQFWQILCRDMPKAERFSLGQKISQLFIQILEYTFTASYLPVEKKIILLEKIIPRHDVLKFFIQVAWENKLIPTEKYIKLSQLLEEIGRQLGGWRNGLIKKTEKKTPAQK